MGSVANFIRFQQCKNFEHRLRYDKVTESLMVGTFLRHSVVIYTYECVPTYVHNIHVQQRVN